MLPGNAYPHSPFVPPATWASLEDVGASREAQFWGTTEEVFRVTAVDAGR